MSLLVMLVASALIGYLAQTTGLCLVRGVNEWFDGRRLRLLAIVLAGFWIYLYIPLIALTPQSPQLSIYDFHWVFLLGGLLYGLGAAANGACAISTASRLSSGELSMAFTMMGWLIGWLVLEYAGFQFTYSRQFYDGDLQSRITWIIIAGLVVAGLAVYRWRRRAWPMWRGIMLVGILAGIVLFYQPAALPSDFVRDLGLAVVERNPDLLPSVVRIAILMLMLIGMYVAAWRYRRFQWVIPDLRAISLRLSSGILMGIGTALAMGGNDLQLLQAVPALSLAGIAAIVSMMAGIRLGTMVLQPSRVKSKRVKENP